jgi:hypothetical protein
LSSDIPRMLRQLSTDELFLLARKKGVRDLKPSTSRPKLVDLLRHLTSQKDIIELLSKRGRSGVKAVIDGMTFEKKAMKLFARKGYKCELGDVSIPGMEFDIVGSRTEGSIFKKTYWIIVECKNKPRVTMQDFDKFLGKLVHFRKKKELEDAQGYLIASGVFDPPVKSAARTHHGLTLMRIKP